MENRLARKALGLLTSPAGLGAMAVLLVNDALLRVAWPSWVTGKLGDFAWLLFFPFALAWAISLIFPRREGWVRGLAFGVTGGVFALAKTLPWAHAAVVGAAEAVVRRPVGWVRDPWDLVALASLVVGWVMWGRAGRGEKSTGWQPMLQGRTGWQPVLQGRVGRALALGAAALLTVANSARPPSIGLERMGLHEGAIYSLGWDRGYVTRDGGLTWRELMTQWDSERMEEAYSEDGATWLGATELCPRCAVALERYGSEPDSSPGVLEAEGGALYRYASGKPIERSEDGGATWAVAYERRVSPAEKLYYEGKYGFYRFYPGPLDALYDRVTGNAIFAMGAEGALVRTPDGAWRWAAVGSARRVELTRGEALLDVLQMELLQAAGFGLLALMTLMMRWRRGLARKIFLGLYWILWMLNALALPDMRSPYLFGLDLALMAGGCVYLLVHIGIELALTLPKQARVGEVGRMALAGVAGAAAFFAPYALWVLAVIPWYGLAVGLGIAAGIGAAAGIGLRRRVAAAQAA